MKSLLAATATLAFLAVPTVASAATFNYVGDYCSDSADTGTICNEFSLEIDTVAGTGTYVEGSSMVPLTWSWNSDLGAALLEFDFAGIPTDGEIRMMVFLDGTEIYGGIAGVSDVGAAVLIGKFSAVRVPN